MTVRRCARCGSTAPEQFVACVKCHALFHAEQLTTLARQADELERQGDFRGALGCWRQMEPLLPPASAQASEVRARLAGLEPRAAAQPGAPSRAPRWLAGVGAAALALLGKGKLLLVGLLKLPTLVSFFLSAALWSDRSSGMGLGLVVLGSIYVHEVGHIWAFRRYGIAVSAPMFVPGFGAFVRGSHYPASARAVGDVALSGPVWGAVAGVVALAAGAATGQAWLSGAAVLVAEVNLFNLLPVWQLDGSRALRCLSKGQALVLAVVGLVGGALAGSPMALLAGGGLLVRRWVRPVSGEGEKRTYWVFLAVLVGLLGLRVAAQWVTQSQAGVP